jgi:hypothetical protein
VVRTRVPSVMGIRRMGSAGPVGERWGEWTTGAGGPGPRARLGGGGVSH